MYYTLPMDKKILCVIPARAGSKGIKNKNLSKIGSESLVEISIKQAIDVGEFTEIFVSTDSDEIFELAKKNGLKQPFKRSSELNFPLGSVRVPSISNNTILLLFVVIILIPIKVLIYIN